MGTYMQDAEHISKPVPSRKKLHKPEPPIVNNLSVNDLLESVGAGLRDFREAPYYGLFFGSIYVAGGWLLILLLLYFDMPYLVYPMAAGFALIAPFIASGFYVVSQNIEEGKELSWAIVFGPLKLMFSRDLGWMALVTGFSMFIWLNIAVVLFLGFFGFRIFEFSELINMIFTTPTGLLFLVLGNVTGALIAFGVFSFAVVSIPMLYHRDIDFITAMITSVRLVVKNPKVMALWCVSIAALIGISLLSGLIGLLVTMPVLGHATWHLYRRGVTAP